MGKDTPSGKRTRWAYLPYSMHMGGSKSSVTGEDFYGAYDAQDIAKANADELGVQAVPSLNLVCNQDGEYVTADEAKAKGMEIKKLSGTKFRRMLRAGEDIPEWFAFKSVVEVLRAEWK